MSWSDYLIEMKPYPIFIGIIVIACAIGYTTWDHLEIKRLLKEFPKLKLDQSISDTILNVHSRKGLSYLELSNDKFSLRPEPFKGTFEFYQVVSKGDLLVKKKGSDTLLLIHQNENHFFRLN